MHKCSLVAALLLTISVSSYSAVDRYSFVSFSDPHVFRSEVTCIHSAKAGFYWAGMSDGLARFDNGKWVLYTAGQGEPGSLPDSGITAIGSDNAGNTWIATRSGLVRYRPERDDFEPTGIGAMSVLAADNCCYFGSVDTLYTYDYSTSAFSVAAVVEMNSSYRISSLSSFQDGRILLSEKNGTPLIFDPSVSRILPLPVDMSGSLLVWVDSRGRIWRSIPGSGVECYSSSFNLLYAFSPDNSSLSAATVLCFCERDGKIWMGTDGGGISVFDPDTREFNVLKHVVANRESFPSRTIKSMCLVKGSNDILAGRSKGGVLAVRRSQMICYDIASPGPTFLAPEGLLCIYQGNDPDRIWIGTDGSGLFQYNLPNRKFIYYNKGNMGSSVRSMAGLNADQILLFCGAEGFKVFNVKQEAVSSFTFGNPALDSSTSDFTLTNAQDGSILITSEEAVFKYDVHSHAIIKVAVPSETIGNGLIRSVAGATSGKYFFNGRYLFNYDSVTESMRILMDAGSASTISSVALDQNDRLWMTSDKGLGCFNVWSGSYECQENDFCRSASAILCDVMGRVWIGGHFGLNVYNTANGSFFVLDETDGMTASDLESNPRLLSLSGDLFFGGPRNLVRVDKNFSLRSYEDPYIGMSSFRADGRKLFNTGKIRLGPNTSLVNVKAYATDDFMLRHKRFKFKVDGPGATDEEFVSETGDFTYSVPASGSYHISASCSTRNAGWTDWKELASFEVAPRLFGSIWEFVAILLLLSATVFFILSLMREKRKGAELSTADGHVPEDVTARLDYLERATSDLAIPAALVAEPLEKAISTLSPDDQNLGRLKGIQRQALKIKSVLNSVITISSAPASESAGLPVNDRVRAVAESFHDEAACRGIILRSEFDKCIGFSEFDASSLRSILATLLMNALRNSPDNTDILIETKYQSQNGTARILVADKGLGIKEASLDDLFRTDHVSTGERQNTFLGLPYIKSLANASGIVLSAKNNSSGGSSFYFEIPASYREVTDPTPVRIQNLSGPARTDANTRVTMPADVLTAEEMIGGSNNPDVIPVTELSQASLLVVEDDLELQDFLKLELQDSVKTLYQAYNGLEAIEILNKNEVDFIVSDVMMPEMDGFALCRYVKTTVTVSHIPIILLTARSDEKSRINGYKNGADDYITKPFDLNVLIDSINNLFLNRQNVRSMFAQGEVFPEVEKVTFSSADEQFMRKFDDLITDNIENPELDVSFIVDAMGISRTVMFNKIKLLTGLNIQNYINKRRMEYVIHLMKTTDLALGEIAERSGFSSPRYFSTSFKNFTGKTPSLYKKELGNPEG